MAGFLRRDLAVVSWNCESLATCERGQRRRKFGFLEQISRDADVVCLQVVRCECVAFERAARKSISQFELHVYPGVRDQAGGVCIMVRRSIAREARIVFDPIIPGRVLGVTLQFRESSVSVLNVHNFGFDDEDIERLRREVPRYLHDSPYRLGVVAGDFSIPLFSDPRTAQLTPTPRDANSRTLQALFNRGVEIIHPAATPLDSARPPRRSRIWTVSS